MKDENGEVGTTCPIQKRREREREVEYEDRVPTPIILVGWGGFVIIIALAICFLMGLLGCSYHSAWPDGTATPSSELFPDCSGADVDSLRRQSE